jgi:hypothetical protein
MSKTKVIHKDLKEWFGWKDVGSEGRNIRIGFVTTLKITMMALFIRDFILMIQLFTWLFSETLSGHEDDMFWLRFSNEDIGLADQRFWCGSEIYNECKDDYFSGVNSGGMVQDRDTEQKHQSEDEDEGEGCERWPSHFDGVMMILSFWGGSKRRYCRSCEEGNRKWMKPEILESNCETFHTDQLSKV